MLTFLLLIMSGLLIPCTVLLYRMHGGAEPKLPWKLDEILIGCVITLTCWAFTQDLFVSSIAGGIGAILKVKGHGQFMTLKFLPPIQRRISPETWDIFLKPLFGIDPRTTKDWGSLTDKVRVQRIKEYGIGKLYDRCVTGLFLSGASVSIGLVGSLVYFNHYMLAVVCCVSFGLSKSVGYMMGWFIYPKGYSNESTAHKDINEATEIGEAMAGYAPGVIAALATASYVVTIF